MLCQLIVHINNDEDESNLYDNNDHSDYGDHRDHNDHGDWGDHGIDV